MSQILLSALVCGVVALVSPFVFRPVLTHIGVLDVPNARSSHARTVLRGGGLAPLSGMLAGGAFAAPSVPLWTVLVIGSMAAVLGFVDDIRGLSARVRFAAQVALGTLLGILVASSAAGSWWMVPLVAVGFAAYVNMTNFMDGINGISALHGAVVGASLAVTGLIVHVEWLVTVGLLLGVSFVLFLPWNLWGSRLFLGDCGSYLLGATIIAVVVCAISIGVPWPAVVAPLSIYVADTGATIVGRVLRKERWWEAHRQHRYQKLVDAGATHLVVAVIVALFTGVAATAGAISLSDTPQATMLSVGGIVAVSALYLVATSLATQTMRKQSR